MVEEEMKPIKASDDLGRSYLVYDMRAYMGDTDDALVMLACDDFKDAMDFAKETGEGVVYRYDVKGNELINEREVGVVHQGGKFEYDH